MNDNLVPIFLGKIKLLLLLEKNSGQIKSKFFPLSAISHGNLC